jgi:hypothetical protein
MSFYETVNKSYNGFNGNQDQHNFIYKYLVPTLKNMLNDIKDKVITTQENTDISNTILYPNFPNTSQTTPFNWDECLYYYSLSGLQSCTFFENEICTFNVDANGQVSVSNIIDNVKTNLYNQYYNLIRTHLKP